MTDGEYRLWDGGGYAELKDLLVGLDKVVVGGGGGGDGGEGGFCLCFWIYVSSPVRPCTVILRQLNSDSKDQVPFLGLSKDKKLTLFPLMNLHEEAPSGSSFSWTDILCTSAKAEWPKDKWVHIGCEVAKKYLRLHIDGAVVGERTLSLSSKNYMNQENIEHISLAGNDGGDGKLQGHFHDIQVLPISSSTTDHLAKNPPVQLSVDLSCISDGIEEGEDGVWSIVGGKASCRRNFSLEVALLDVTGQSVHKEMELFASLVYADNQMAVEKPNNDAEAPLLMNCDGLEFPSTDRPVKLIHGRASFKLKMSQLSSKCDNRLFRIRFYSSDAQKYPFLEAYSFPIRCISRNRSTRGSSGSGKKMTSATQLLDGSLSPGDHERSPEIQDNYGGSKVQSFNKRDSKCSPSSKRLKVRHDDSSARSDANGISTQQNDRCNSHNLTENDDENAIRTSSDPKIENYGGADNVPSDSESTDARNSVFVRTEDNKRNPISDALVFKYCLESVQERAMLLREVIDSASNQDMIDLAEQVSLYAGCSHHRYQILIAKQLLEEGADLWNSISRNNYRVLWADAVREIEKKFMTISHSVNRGLSRQDREILRRIAGCGDDMARENFDKMWHWLFPVAFTLSKDQINAMWESLSPKWIEGIITKEEAENSLRCPRGLLNPGTFILWFPTSRSWPHPDAGSLVVTFVGSDCSLHSKLLLHDDREMNPRPLQELLLEEPELSHLGRVTRQVTQFDRDAVEHG